VTDPKKASGGGRTDGGIPQPESPPAPTSPVAEPDGGIPQAEGAEGSE
jgi:hypothetical protein